MTGRGSHIAITGASGFIGSRLTWRLLSNGAKVTAIVRERSDVAYLQQSENTHNLHIARLAADYSNLNDIFASSASSASSAFDAVVHLAACTDGGDDEGATRRLIEANLLFPSLILAAMQTHKVRAFINTGTSWQNAESAEFRPFNLYAASKQAFEQVMIHHVEAGLAAVTLRLFDVYGPNDPRNKIINLLLRASQSKDLLDMTRGEQKIDLVHVDDVCGAYEAALQYVLGRPLRTHAVFGVSSGRPLPMRNLVGVFDEARGVRCPINWGKRPYRDREIMSPYSGLEEVPGWQPTIELAAGLKSL
jgi:nucleoside-diphosphate-sugar epimerase